MGRELKRVPMDFDYPIDTLWDGYVPDIETFQKIFGEDYPFVNDYTDVGQICGECEKNCGECSEEADYCFWYNKDNKDQWFKEIPEGDGYQLWSTTCEGCPVTPVFETLDELCEYCEKNVSIFADIMKSKEEWKQMLNDNCVYLEEGNIMFI